MIFSIKLFLGACFLQFLLVILSSFVLLQLLWCNLSRRMRNDYIHVIAKLLNFLIGTEATMA